MNFYINRNINEESIVKVDFFCNFVDEQSSPRQRIQEKFKLYQGKKKLFIDCYLTLMNLINNYDENLNLEGIRILTNEGETYQISFYDIEENQVVFSDYALQFMINILEYVSKQETSSIKVLDFETLDYVDYFEEESKVNLKRRG